MTDTLHKKEYELIKAFKIQNQNIMNELKESQDKYY